MERKPYTVEDLKVSLILIMKEETGRTRDGMAFSFIHDYSEEIRLRVEIMKDGSIVITSLYLIDEPQAVCRGTFLEFPLKGVFQIDTTPKTHEATFWAHPAEDTCTKVKIGRDGTVKPEIGVPFPKESGD